MFQQIWNWLRGLGPEIDPRHVAILTAFIERLRTTDCRLDRTWLRDYVQRNAHAEYGSFGKKLERLFSLADDDREPVDLIPLRRLRFSKNEITILSRALQTTGLAAYGLPMLEMATNDRLISPLLYQLAFGTFRLDESDRKDLQKLAGTYRILLREKDSDFVEARLLVVDAIDARGGRAANNRGRVDARGVIIEISKDERRGALVARAGSFIPFHRFHVALLASPPPATIPVQLIFDRQIQVDVPEDAAPTLELPSVGDPQDAYFHILTLENLGADEIAGTYQYRHVVGRFSGVRKEAFTPADVRELGLLTEPKVRNLPLLEQQLLERFSRLSPSKEHAPTTPHDESALIVPFPMEKKSA